MIGHARSSIWITQLAFDADCRVYGVDARDEESDAHTLLLDALIEAASARSVTVHIILNATRLLDTAKPLRAALERAGASGVTVRGITSFPQLLHAKMLIVDEREAILLGSPFVNGYWDHAAHPPSDARRPERELGGRPLHDLSIHISGPHVQPLCAIFAELWNDASVGSDDDAPIECAPPRERAPVDGVRIVRTAPRGVLRRHPHGLTEILRAIEAALASARRLVYVEHQYLSSRRVIDALAASLERAPDLEIVIVLNQNPDVTAYRSWQNARLRDARLLSHPRVGIFTLWRATPSAGPEHDWVVNQVFVHSKVLVVDDEWVTAGSANLDGVSLHSYGHDFTAWLGRRVFRNVRNFDVNVVIDGAGAHARSAIDLRTRLWSEHLALPQSSLAQRPAGGWLSLWRRRADDGVAMLSAPAAPGAPQSLAVILPYNGRATPSKQLRDAGVRGLERIDLLFDPGWVEKRLSPNWLRNTFA